jgi:RimJ/RimL family protein N-acetyltransferase
MPIEIVRDQVLIRSWNQSDVAELGRVTFDNLDHLRPWIPWAYELPANRAKVRAAMGAFLVEAAAKPDELVGLFSGGQVAGGSGLHPRIGPGGYEIGYWVRRDLTRRGIATAAACALTDHAFTRPDIDRIEIRHDRANVASEGVPRRLGYSLVGEEASVIATPEQSGVHLIWRITRDEWMARPGP